jgi:hypothetical protein
LLPCPNTTHMWHISDVFVWRAWAQQNPPLRTMQVNNQLRKGVKTCEYIEQPSCESKVLLKHGDHGIMSLTYDHNPPRALEKIKKLCFIHFQGFAKKTIPEFYYFFSKTDNLTAYILKKSRCW